MAATNLLIAVAQSGEVREFPLAEADRRALIEGINGPHNRLVAVWEEEGGPTRFVVRAGVGPWPAPDEDEPEGPERWARADAAAFDGQVRYRLIGQDPWTTLAEGFLQPGQLNV